MLKNIFIFFCLLLFPVITPHIAYGASTRLIDTTIPTRGPDDTACATKVFADALARTADPAAEMAHETVIQQWIYQTFAEKDVLNLVLACPEIANTPEGETIKFMPIMYTFPNGREIIVNYETQPKLLKQRLMLSEKRGLPTDNPNPRLGDPDDAAIWTNTEPAWYAIMIVEHGALDEFVGPDKNNTLAIEYIRDHIDELYPNADDNGGKCTARSALADDDLIINKVMSERTVNMEDDSNDYYIAGDVNLQWITYLEIALDIVITVVTMGGGIVITGATKAARASRALKGLTGTIKTLSKSDDVIKWTRATRDVADLTNKINKLDKAKDAAKIADLTKDLDKAKDTVKTLDATNDVKKYREATKTFSELNAYRRGLRSLKLAQRGNVVARAARATKSAMTGNKLITKAARMGRSSGFANQAKDWLFHSTMKNAAMLGKLEAAGGLAYGAIKFIGGMYDWTETETGDFTSGVEFAPLLLLSADDLEGQENVVNHGMWLMWMGDSISDNDDDAAYLQAMDFASKFHEDLKEEQGGNTPCNVDIYVVRPILRNPGSDNPALYYLIMNDEPWTTNE